MKVLSRRRFLWSAGGLVAGGSLGARWLSSSAESLPRSPRLFTRSGAALGTTVTLHVVHEQAEQADRALESGFQALEHVEDLMSLYRPQSQLSRLNRDRIIRDPHPDLVTVLTAAEELSRQTDGAFDVTVQPLWALYAACNRSGRAPTASELTDARRKIDWQAIEIQSGSIRLRKPGAQVTLNGIAQGFAVDQVSAALRQHGIEHALIDTGEIAGVGRKSTQESWKVGLQDPRHRDSYAGLIELDGRCLATSGDYATTFDQGRSQSTDHHIFDPRTGRSPTELASVSVLAPNGMWADGISTALCVLGINHNSTNWLSLIPDVDALIITRSGQSLATPGFPVVS